MNGLPAAITCIRMADPVQARSTLAAAGSASSS
jgi:hypothetical protein